MRKEPNPPGIKIRVAKDGVIQLVDRATGRWLANVRWRPCGEVWVELAEGVGKAVNKLHSVRWEEPESNSGAVT